MTNSKKAKELAFTENGTFLPRSEAIRRCCIEMAEWKDQQYVDVIKEECNASYESGFAEGEKTAEARFKEYLEKKKAEQLDARARGMVGSYYKRRMVEEIINELFKEEEK